MHWSLAQAPRRVQDVEEMGTPRISLSFVRPSSRPFFARTNATWEPTPSLLTSVAADSASSCSPHLLPRWRPGDCRKIGGRNISRRRE